MPGSVSAPDSGDPVTQLVPHEDAPAYSDIATTATVAATSPLTTFSPPMPRSPISVPQKESSYDWIRWEEKVSPTTDSLTTQVPLSGRSSARSGITFPAAAPSSVKPDEGEAKETAGKTKPSLVGPLLNSPLTLRKLSTTMASIATPTSTLVTAVQTAGRLRLSLILQNIKMST